MWAVKKEGWRHREKEGKGYIKDPGNSAPTSRNLCPWIRRQLVTPRSRLGARVRPQLVKLELCKYVRGCRSVRGHGCMNLGARKVQATYSIRADISCRIARTNMRQRAPTHTHTHNHTHDDRRRTPQAPTSTASLVSALSAADAAGVQARAQFPSQSRLLSLGTPPPISADVDARVVSLPSGAGLDLNLIPKIADRFLAEVDRLLTP